jgi:hypothetical protein
MEKWKTTNRFPTFPHATSDDDSWSKLKTQNVRKEVGRCAASSPSLFHDHLVLETIPCFMIILRLENASAVLLKLVADQANAGPALRYKPACKTS